MPLLYAQGGRLGDSGGGVVNPSQFTSQGAIVTGNRPCFVWFRGDLYTIGYYSRPVVRHQAGGGFVLAGIRPPLVPLTVVPDAGAGGSSGPCLAAITFLHKAGLLVLAESNFSNTVNVGTLTGQGRTWSSIDNVSAESRVTHVRGYVSMNGADFRMAWEAPYGISTITENTRTAQLVFVGPEYDNDVPPSTRFGFNWFGRMWYANNAVFPYRIWFSKPGLPQYVPQANFRDTLGKESITAVWEGRNELLVWCERKAYMIRSASGQPGSDDFVMEKLDSDVGCISHFGVQEIHNKVWFPSEDGVWIYDGSFKYLMKEIQPLWAVDSGYGGITAEDAVRREAFRKGFFMHDRQNKVYAYVTNRLTRPEYEETGLFPGTVAYVGYYGAFEPSMAGDERHPAWTLDCKDRFDSAAFYNRDGDLVIGSCDGKIRKQDKTEGEDDGDLLRKTAIIRTGHALFFEPGDELEFNKTLLQLWAYVESESNAWTMYVKGGDEQAWKGRLPDSNFWYWADTVPASGKQETRQIKGRDQSLRTYTMRYAPLTVTAFTPEKATGSGFTFELRAVAPIGMEYRGVGGMWGPGPDQRGVDEVTNFFLFARVFEEGATVLPIDPRHTMVIGGAGSNLIDFQIDCLGYEFGSVGLPINVTITAVGVNGYVATGTIPAIGLDAGFAYQHAIAPGDDWTITISGVDANGVPANPLYTFRITRP